MGVDPAIALVDIMDGRRSSRLPLTTLVLVSGNDRLRDMAGMHVTDVVPDGGGIRPRPAGRRNGNKGLVGSLVGGSTPQALLSSDFAPLPPKLVAKIQSGQYV